MSYLLTTFGAAILVFRPSVVEGGEINLLRMQRQMGTDGCR